MPKKNSKPDKNTRIFLHFAQAYYRAANQVFDLQDAIKEPVYFLYHHTVETALKAFLCSLGIKPEMIHDLTKLYEECRNLGLTIGSNDQTDIRNIVNLLDHGNRHHGFRYGYSGANALPDLTWTREVIKELMLVVERDVDIRCPRNLNDERAVTLRFTLGRPTEVEE